MITIRSAVSVFVILCLICPWLTGAANVGRDPAGALVMENDVVRFIVDPAHGGSVVSFVHKPLGQDVIPPGRPDQMGLLLDHYWQDGWKWPGEMMEAAYEVVSIEPGPAEAAVTMRYRIKGEFQDRRQPRLAGLVFEKRIGLRAESDAVVCDVSLINPTTETKLIAYWSQQYFFAGGDYDKDADVFSRPSSRGVRRFGWTMGNVTDFLADATAGWSAATDVPKKSTLAWLFDYNYLNKTYDSNGNITLEWLYDTVMIPPGKSLKTRIAMIPAIGLPTVAHVSPQLMAGYDVRRTGDAVAVTHFLRMGISPAKGIELTVALEGPIDNKKTPMQRARLEQLDMEVRTIEQRFVDAPKDPFVIRVAATGPDWTESYWDFHCGGYGYGDNVQQDMATPLFAVPPPPKKQAFMKPDRIIRVKEAAPRYFVMTGLVPRAFVPRPLEARTSGLHSSAIYDSATYSISTFGQGPKLSQFPLDYDALMRYDALVACNVNIGCLGLLGGEMTRDYLTHGGSLLVLGGKAAYGAGSWRGSGLEEFLPVTLDESSFDIVSLSDDADIKLMQPHPATEGLDLSARPRVAYIHQATAKSNAKVLLVAGGRPVLVVWEKGPSRVACVLAAPYGDTAVQQAPLFFDWPDWPRLINQVLLWLAGRL